MADRVRIFFDADDGPTETLWAEAVGANRFRLDNVPREVSNVSMGDVVAAQPLSKEMYEFVAVVEPGGHSTYHVLVSDPDSSGTEGALSGLTSEGCGLEHFTKGLIGVDVPPSADIVRVFRLLESAMAAGIWTFDEMNFEHEVPD